MSQKIKIFYSYSHADEDLKNELDKHLAMLKRNELIDVWNDRALVAGQDWDESIKRELLAADIIISLISADFLSSNYIWDVELKEAMRRNEAKEAVLVSVILRPCEWKDAPFAKWQLLPRNALPVVKWPDIDSAFVNVVKGLKQVIDLVKKRKEDFPVKGQTESTDPVKVESFRAYGRELIKYNMQDKLLLLMETHIQEGESMDDRILLLASRWDTLKKYKLSSDYSETKFWLEKAKINRGVIDVLDEMEDFSLDLDAENTD